MVTLPSLARPPLPTLAVTVLERSTRAPDTSRPPAPSTVAALLLIVLLVIVVVPPRNTRMAPTRSATLPLNVLPAIVEAPALSKPAAKPAVLSDTVDPVSANIPSLWMPPPEAVAELADTIAPPEIVTLEAPRL